MGKSSKQPTHTTQTTTSEYPTELKPFIQDIFGKAKGVSDQRAADGYQPYNAPRVAEFTEDQETSFQGIRDVQGASQPYFGAQTNLINRSTQGPSAARTAQYMNPYTQNVIDIQQRELGRQGEQERQKIGAGAANAGSFGGSRQAILEAEQMRNQGMRGDDIQARGMNQAYGQAQQAMSQADARGLQGAGMYGQMATQIPAQRMKELGALSGVGSALQQQQQRGLDLGFEQFQNEYNYPMRNLNEYSAILRGFPLAADQSTNRYQMSPSAPLSSQLLGAGAGLGSAAMMGGMFGAAGGQVAKLQQGGLAGMYAPPSNRVRMGKTNYQDASVDMVDNLLNSKVDEDKPFGRLETEGSYDLGKPYTALYRLVNPWWQQEAKNEGKMTEDGIPITNQNMSLTDESRTEIKEALKFGIDKSTGKPWTIERIQELGVEDIWIEVKEEEEVKKEPGGTSQGLLAKEIVQGNKLKDDFNALRDITQKNAQLATDAKDERILYKTWLPVLASASKIMSAPDFGSAVGELFNAGARGVAGRMKGKADEVTLRAATLNNGLKNAALLATIHKDLTPGAAIAGLSTALESLFKQGAKRDDPTIKNLLGALESYATQTGPAGGENITNLIQRFIKPNVGGTVITDDMTMTDLFANSGQFDKEAFYNQKKAEGGTVSLAKGGTPIRSFDFVEEDGILKAVQTESN
jgi:hypothetical protein